VYTETIEKEIIMKNRDYINKFISYEYGLEYYKTKKSKNKRSPRFLVISSSNDYGMPVFDEYNNVAEWFKSESELVKWIKGINFAYKNHGLDTEVKKIVEFR
jgi:hypothetical protein